MSIDADGRLPTVDVLAATPPLIFSKGLLSDADGRLVVTTTEPVAHFQNGLPFAADGALCVTAV